MKINNNNRLVFFLMILGAVLIAFSQLVDSDTWGVCFDAVFSWVPDHPPKPLEPLFGMLMMPFLVLHGFSFMGGTALMLFAVGAWLRRSPPSSDREREAFPLAVILPVLGNCFLVIQALPFLRVPQGTVMRPMGWTFFNFQVALAITIIGLSLSVALLMKKQRKMLAVIGIALSLAPIFTMMIAFHAVVAIKGLVLAP